MTSGWDRGALAIAGVLVALAVASNADDLRNGAHTIRAYSDFVQPGLGALELARPTVAADFRPEPTRAPDIEAGKYFEAVDRFGSPADDPKELATRIEAAREAADLVLLYALRLAGRPVPEAAGAGAAPRVTLAEGGEPRPRGACVTFRPAGAQGAIELDLPPGGMTVSVARGEPAQVYLRRFGDAYVPNGVAPAEPEFVKRQAFGRGLLRGEVLLAPGGRTTAFAIPTDRARAPWHARVVSGQRLVACGI